MIQFDQVTKKYGSRTALDQVSLTLGRGEMVFLTGHSGAGKSTLLNLLMRVMMPSRGDIYVNQRKINQLSRRQVSWMRRNMGFMMQDPRLLFDRTVFDNVAIPLWIAGFQSSEMSRRVRAALDRVGLLGKEKVFPQELSCGEQQRVGMARAVVNRPLILLADEPTGNLDPALSQGIVKLLSDFSEIGVTVLMATHDLDTIASFPYRQLVLEAGRLREGI